MLARFSIQQVEQHFTEQKETRKYQFMEANTQRRSNGLKEKIPDIQKTLDTILFLKTRKV